jgi:glycosyltransferase involved in cell wall biosynthesis
MMGAGRLRILSIARAYPPTVGGMEQLALQVNEHMRRHADVIQMVNRGGKKALPAFLPYTLAAALREVRRGSVDAVYLADAMLAPMGAALKAASGVPVVATVHGLDVTWKNPVYQSIVPRALRQLDLVMPNSRATDAAMRERTGALPPSRVVPLGVNPLPAPTAADIEEFAGLSDLPAGTRVVITVGRLIERKGVAWFVANVLPRLAADVMYLVIGDGPQRAAIEHAAERANVVDRVRMTGRVSDGVLAAAYRRADVFVMPNVPVAGDMEGFGLVALEASASGVPVVAAALEGITEAVQQGRNGLLVRPLDGVAMARTIEELLGLPHTERRMVSESYARFTMREYGWDKTAARYVEEIESLVRAPLRAAA